MKLRKLIRCATAAVVASAMALSISMPALASTWNLSDYSRIEVYEGSNETNRVNYIPHAEEGAPAASDNRDDSDTVFKGKAKAGTTVTLHDNSEVTFKDAEFENSSGVPLTVGWYEGSADVKIHLEGDSSFLSNDGGIRILSGTLTIDGNGTLTINGTKTSGAINEPDSVTVAGNAGLIIKEYTHTAETDPVKVDGSNAWVKYVDAATGETYKTLGNAANVPVDNVEDYKITVTVGGKTYKVTSANCGDILGDDYTSGKLSYSDNILTGLGELPGMTIETLNAVDVELYNNDGGIVVNGNLTIDGAQNVTVVSENNNTSTAWGTVINGDANITCTNDVLLENKGAGDVVGGNGSRKKLKVTGARDVTVRGKCETSTYTVFGDAEIDCNRDITITSEYSTAVLGNLIVTKARKVKVVGNGSHGVGGDATITCSGTVVLENKASGSAVDGTLTYTPNPTKPYEIKAGTDAGDAAAMKSLLKQAKQANSTTVLSANRTFPLLTRVMSPVTMTLMTTLPATAPAQAAQLQPCSLAVQPSGAAMR